MLISGVIQQTTLHGLEEKEQPFWTEVWGARSVESVEMFGVEGVVVCRMIQKVGKSATKQAGEYHAQVLKMLLVIGGVEQNPGPTSYVKRNMMQRKGIMQWSHWNLDSAFQYARVGKDQSYEARVERLLGLCEPNSNVSNQLCEQHESLMNGWRTQKENYQTQKKGSRSTRSARDSTS